MRNSILILLLSIVTFSCDKEKQTSKKISGEWTPVSHKITADEGLSYYGTINGSLSITENENSGTSNNFNWSTSTTSEIGAFDFQFNGLFEIIEKGGYMNLIKFGNSGNPMDTTKTRIYKLTRTDMSLEFSDDQFRTHFIVFQKN
jgi:hypothetical protein